MSLLLEYFNPPPAPPKKAVHKSTENPVLLAFHLQYRNNFTFPLSVDNVIQKNKGWISSEMQFSCLKYVYLLGKTTLCLVKAYVSLYGAAFSLFFFCFVFISFLM